VIIQWSADEEKVDYSYNYQLLNTDQWIIFDEIIQVVLQGEMKMTILFYIDGPVEVGKLTKS
jgi:hypothetical protein